MPSARDILEQFENQWQTGAVPAISHFLDSLGTCATAAERRELLHEMVAVDLWHRWTSSPPDPATDAGELQSRPRLDDYAHRYVDFGPLAKAPSLVIREEYRVRRMHGELLNLRDYCARFAGRDDFLRDLHELERELVSRRAPTPRREDRESSGSEPFERVVRCPYCQGAVSTVADALETVIHCPACDGSIRLVSESTVARRFAAGSTIHHFQLVEQLGSGSFGAVWSARDTKLDREVAIKIPRYGQLEPAEVAIFLREARSAAQLHHPNIVAVHEVGLVDDVPYIVSDLVRGTSLSEDLKRRRYTPREAATLCAKIADALHHAHEAGVVHRDLKPGNLLLDASGEPHLTDFGLARRAGAEATLTSDGVVLGTPAYMSPEQARGEGHQADRRSDVYSLGIVFYQMLTGETPFRGSAQMMMLQVIHDDPPSPRTLVSGIPRDLETICLKCLEKNPDRRYATAAALADDLRRYLRGVPISARPIGHLERAWKLGRAHPMAATLVLSTIMFLSVLAAVLAMWNVQKSSLVEEVRRNRTSARVSYGLAEQVIIDVHERLQFIPGADAIREEILQRGLREMQRLVAMENQFEGPARLMAAGRFGLGQIFLRQGDAQRAEEQFHAAHAAALARLRETPDDMQAQREVAISYGNLADLNLAKGNPDAARTNYEQAITSLKGAAISEDAAMSRLLMRLGFVCIGLRDLDYARKCLDEAHQLRSDAAAKDSGDLQLARELWEVTLYRGDAKLAAADLPGAMHDYREAIRLAEAKLNKEANGFLGSDDTATSYERLATVLLGQFDIERAKQYYERALQLREQLAAQNPTNAEHQRALATLHDRLGAMWLGLQNADLAHERFKTSFDIRQKLAAAHSDNDLIQIEILSSHGYLARAEDGRSNFDEAIRWYDQGLQLWSTLNVHGKLEQQPRLAQLRFEFEAQRGRCTLKRRGLDELREVTEEYPELAAELLQARAFLLAKRGDFDQAQATVKELATLRNAQPAALDYAAYAFARLAEIVGDALSASSSTQDMHAKQAFFADQAIAMLERAHSAGAYQKPGAAVYLRYSDAYQRLRSRTEFERLLDAVASGNTTANLE